MRFLRIFCWTVCLLLLFGGCKQDSEESGPSQDDNQKELEPVQGDCQQKGLEYVLLDGSCIHLPSQSLTEPECKRIQEASWEADLELCFHPAMADVVCAAKSGGIPIGCVGQSAVASSFISECEEKKELERNLYRSLWLNLVNLPLDYFSCQSLVEHIWKKPEIVLHSVGLQDGSWLPIAANARSLDLWGNQLKDLTPIYGMTNLTTLKLGSNQIESLNGIEKLENLQRLSLPENLIQDFSILSRLSKLKFLDISFNPGAAAARLEVKNYTFGFFADLDTPKQLEVEPSVLPAAENQEESSQPPSSLQDTQAE